ncbi:MAG: EAL domain-containing protein [Glaciecola sp.]
MLGIRGLLNRGIAVIVGLGFTSLVITYWLIDTTHKQEITETSLISDLTKAKKWITRVNQMGFRIAIDDFGTGYSSLSYLTSFPFDCVKLDRSLLLDVEENQRTRDIVESITKMIQALNVPVVAEGIETESHLAVIQQLGCDYVQGYYFSRPLPVDDLHTGLLNYKEKGKWIPAS